MAKLDYFIKDKGALANETGVKRSVVSLSSQYSAVFKYEVFLTDVCVVAYICPGSNDNDDIFHMFLCLSGDNENSIGSTVSMLASGIRSGRIVVPPNSKISQSLNDRTLSEVALIGVPQFWAMRKDISIDMNSDFSNYSEQNLRIVRQIVNLFEYTMDMFGQLARGRMVAE